MTENEASMHLQGFLLAALAALLGGSTMAPIKFQRKWQFENTWLVYSICAYFVAPLVVAFATVPRLGEVYASSGMNAILLTAIFGFGWGVAVVLNGYAITLIGLALTFGILMGSSIAVGSLLPVLLVNPGKLATPYGTRLIVVNLGLLLGVLLCTIAGDLRERRQTKDKPKQERSAARTGIVICLLAGVLSTMQNVALTYGAVIAKKAEEFGTAPFNAANSVWAVAVTAGSLPSIVWCIVQLRRKRTWPLFSETAAPNTLRCVLMGAIWISGTVLYGAATRMMGPLGPAIGWPIFMSGMILTAAVWGWLTGEWRGAGGRAAGFMIAGVAVQIVCMAVLGRLQ
jgi:L-rhamnose-H+ transport protein